MEDDVDPLHGARERGAVADVAVDDGHSPSRHGMREVLAPAAHEIVVEHDLGGLLLRDQVGDVRPDQPGAAGDENPLALHDRLSNARADIQTLASCSTAATTCSTCVAVISGNIGSDSTSLRGRLGVREVAGLVAEVGVRLLQVHRNRVVQARLDALGLQLLLQPVAIGAAHGVDVVHVPAIGQLLRCRHDRRARQQRVVLRARARGAPRSTARGDAASRAGWRPGCLPSGS